MLKKMIFCSVRMVAVPFVIRTQKNTATKGSVTDNANINIGTSNVVIKPLETTNEAITCNHGNHTITLLSIPTKPWCKMGLSIKNIFNPKWRKIVFYDSSPLQREATPVDDTHFTPETPFLANLSLNYFF